MLAGGQVADMALARLDSSRNFGLRKPVPLDFFDDVRPIHKPYYRLYDLESKRLNDIYLSQNSGMQTFRERVREARKKLKLTQQQLARLSGMAQATLSDIERGKNEGSRDVVALASALQVSAEWLINGKQSDDHAAVVAEFAAVYAGSNQTWRTFLETSIHAARGAIKEADKMAQEDIIKTA